MTMDQSPPWKFATTRSMLFAVMVVTLLAIVFYFVMTQVFSESRRPVTESEKEQFWRDLEQAQARRELAARTNAATGGSISK